VTRIVDLKPEKCDRCAAELDGSDPHPMRSQVIDLPPVDPDVTEYRRHTLPCARCGALTTAPLPRDGLRPRVGDMRSLSPPPRAPVRREDAGVHGVRPVTLAAYAAAGRGATASSA
jgi:hypothetical protein